MLSPQCISHIALQAGGRLLSRLKSNGNVIGVAFMAQLYSLFMHEGVLTHHDEENQGRASIR
jgi:hypothetical protein